MVRYYLCPIVGTGMKSNPYRPKLADYGVSFVAMIKNSVNGAPLFNWTICAVDASLNQTSILADSTIIPLPVVSLDTLWSSVSITIQLQVQTVAIKFGVSLPTGSQITLRDILKSFGQFLDSTFNELNFSVG